jgi:hypothetical protein
VIIFCFFVFCFQRAEELPNPDQSLILGFFRDRKLSIAPLSSRYNLNCRIPSDANTRILHFNVNSVKPWDYTLKEADELVAERRADDAIWRYVVQWLELELQIDIAFPKEKTSK